MHFVRLGEWLRLHRASQWPACQGDGSGEMCARRLCSGSLLC